MTDLETILLHCELEPSVEALSYAADEYLAAGDEEMYRGLAYMAENDKMPWKSQFPRTFIGYLWSQQRSLLRSYKDNLTIEIIGKCNYLDYYHKENTFADSVRWLGKRLREMDAEEVFRAEQSIPDDAGIMS